MNTEMFDNVIEFPDPGIRQRYESLVGLDHTKVRIAKEARLLFDPLILEEWSKKHHGKKIKFISQFSERSPLFLFSGDVGTGKTSLAESFGEAVSREESIPITFYRLSLKTRGGGLVGEMTKLLTGAFEAIATEAKKYKKPGKKPTAAIILLIDEADALAQSREFDQMNHEDKAGVNALIQGVDSIAKHNLPVLVVMCTNRLNSIDPAVKRRAQIFDFPRPNAEQRESILAEIFEEVGFSKKQIKTLVDKTGPTEKVEYGYTYSDLRQRLLPNILLDAFPDQPITFENALEILVKTPPTPPFKEN